MESDALKGMGIATWRGTEGTTIKNLGMEEPAFQDEDSCRGH
jgi:hypothetical protein